MAYDSGDPWPGVQIGGLDGKPLILPFRGKCSDLATDDIFMSIQVGGQDGKPLQSFSLAQCDGSALPSDTPLLGVHVGGKDGKPLVAGFCETCGGGGEITICECTVTGGLCLTVENNAVNSPPLTGTLPLEGEFTLSETTWGDIVADYEYNVTVIDNTDIEHPVPVSDDWYFDPIALLGVDPGGQWFTTDWQTVATGFDDTGTTEEDGKRIDFKHVVNVGSGEGCTLSLYTFVRIFSDNPSVRALDHHTLVWSWGQNVEDSPFYYYNEDDSLSPVYTYTRTWDTGGTVGSVSVVSTDCDPFLIERQVDSTIGAVYMLWDSGADNSYQFTNALWSIHECG